MAVCVEQLILGHAYDEYSVLAKNPGMTESHHFFIIFILAKTTEMQVRERTMVQNIEKW